MSTIHARWGRRRLGLVWAALVPVLLAGQLMVMVPAASADDHLPPYLTVTKTVDNSDLSPGQPFTYTIRVSCVEASCLDAQLTDVLPPELEGFAVQGVTTTPAEGTVPRLVTWVEGGEPIGQPTVVGAETGLTVDFTGTTSDPVGTGLEFGNTFTIQIALQAPADLPPGAPYDIVNTASTTATNSLPDSDDATVTVTVPLEIDVDVTKSWGPTPQSFNPGSPSIIGLAVTNASNVAVDALVVQEPAAADDDATQLAATNPFTITDFTGFGDSTLPPGADEVTVDAYVYDGTTWSWQAGTPGPEPVLPGGVDPADVGGIRLTYTGEIAPGAAGSIELDLAQRATDRDTGDDLSTASHTVGNVAQATAIPAGDGDPVSDTATATYTVNPAHIGASASKDIQPNRISAGDTASAAIGGTNESDVGVDELRLADLDYFTEHITFEGFTSGPSWPENAASAEVVYHLLGGGDPETVPFTEGTPPADPGGPISGFEIVFTATDGGIVSGATTNAEFAIATTEDATGDEAEITTTNTVVASVVAPNGLDAEDAASDDLVLVTPGIDVTLDKRVLPATPVEPGGTVVAELSSRLTTTSDYVTATELVVEDAWDGEPNEFWDAFDLTSIAGTQVPSETSLTIEVQATVGTWVELEVYPAQPGPFIASMSTADIEAALPGAVDITDVTGVRFTFDNPGGLPSDTIVTPYVVASARGELRSGGDTTSEPDEPVAYENTATTTGTGTTPPGTPLEDTDSDTGQAEIVTYDGTGPVGIDKAWNEATVPAQSSAQRTTDLLWQVSQGYSVVTITDPTNPATPAGSVFQAFDLVGVNPIPFGTLDQPFTNGWYLRYDTITAVQLYSAEEEDWVPVDVPTGGWIDGDGFVGYTLTAAERADTTGVRLVLEENAQAREEAQAGGPPLDPFAPASGSGVAASSTGRTFTLTWEIRDTTRVGGDWVTAEDVYNVAGSEGVVDNTVGLEAVPPVGVPAIATGNDTIVIIDPGPGVVVDKAVDVDEPIFVPREGTTDADYPTATFTVTANNDSVARASYVRVTDPAPCSDTAPIADCQSAGTAAGAVANPFTGGVDWLNPGGVANPFDRFDLTGVTIGAGIADEVDLAATTVWLLRYDAESGTYTPEETTATAVNALGEADLADVVGISVTFQDTDPATTGGTITSGNELTITFEVRLRSTIRSTGDPQVLAAGQTVTVTNRAFAQSYDPVLSHGVATGDLDAAGVVLTGGVINVDPTKAVSPITITEPGRDQPVTVTLGANQGVDPRSTLSPAEVWLRDDVDSSAEFWDRFEVTGLGAIAAPAGADRVAVDVFGPFGDGGALEWVEGAPTPIADAVIPIDADDHPEIEGIRFTFSRDDGGFFSTAVPAPDWSATAAFTVQLRDTYRDSGEPIEFPVGETVAVANTVTVQSDRLTGEASEEKEATATIDLTAGTQELSVNKLANDGFRSVEVGANVPWDLTFENTGTGFLTITELRDTLPASLVHLGAPAPTYTADPDGLLSDDVTFDQDGQDLVVTWPTGGRTMAPGEIFSIRIHLELQPIGSGQQAVNTITVRTVEDLDSCSNIVTGGDTTGAWAGDPTTCGTTDYVQPAVGPNLFTVKGVRGALEGAYNPADPDQVCSPSLNATGGDYYRAPCVAHSLIGGTDDWVLRTLNAGTVDVEELTIFDQLPVEDDRFLVSGTSRGSAYRPQIVPGSLGVTAPTGTEVTIEVTTATGVCQGTWSNLENQEPCEQNGEIWLEVDGSTDWAQVSGLRVHLDFEQTEAGALEPLDLVDVTFSTVNRSASPDDPSGAPSDVPATDSLAWNQFGVKYLNAGSTSYDKLAPSRVGVHLLFGPLQVDKVVTGPAAAYAAGQFLVDVTCEVGDIELSMGGQATVALNEANGYSHRIDGIPVGATCTLTEQGDVGEFGETAREGTPTDIDIEIPAGVDDEVPEAQVATITNVYEAADLSITKRLQTDATGVELGPFGFSLTCESAIGIPVTFGGDVTELAFTLAAGETYTVPADTVPVGATCTLVETDTSFVDEIVITGTGVTDNGDGSAVVVLTTDPLHVEVANRYEASTLVVAKRVDGAGADLYGAGPFGFDVECTYQGQTVLDLAFDLAAGADRAFGPYPAGTSCVVAETATGGATLTVIDPADGAVTIGGDEPVVVTATNTFDVTSLEVTKVVAGDTTAPGASGPFTVALECTWLVDGVITPVDIPGGATRQLTVPDGFVATYGPLPVGSTCHLTETATGGADSTTVTVGTQGADPSVTQGVGTTLTLPTSTAAGHVGITVENTFAPIPPDTDPASTAPLDTGPASTTRPSSSPPGPATPPRGLPATGADVAAVVATAGFLVMIGATLIGIRRWRLPARAPTFGRSASAATSAGVRARSGPLPR